jgi:FkbM family methyltransferase
MKKKVSKYFKKIKNVLFPSTNNHLRKLKFYLDKYFTLSERILIVDVGAHRGQSIELFKKIFKNSIIHSFEPTPDLAAELKIKYEFNKDVFISNYALGDFEGKVKFYLTRFSAVNSRYRVDKDLYQRLKIRISPLLENTTEKEVPMTTLTNYSRKTSIPVIDILKIDTQGSELNILHGAKEILTEKVKLIIIELHYHQFYKNSSLFFDVCKFLYEEDFYLLDYLDINRKNKYILLESDAIFLNRKYFDLRIN